MTSSLVTLVVVILVIAKQLKKKPVKADYKGLFILLAVGLVQLAEYLLGEKQIKQLVDGKDLSVLNHLTFEHLVTAHLIIAILGSFVLAFVMAFIRVPTFKIWKEDGIIYKQGTWLSALLWIISISLHLGYDQIVAHATGGNSGFGSATTALYLFVSLGMQRVLYNYRGSKIMEKIGDLEKKL
ncbi:MAG: hypothetical protein LBN08_06170 [Lactobacillales bacterium]|jgi:hypothetical protein|nr:hypothetical protein [Lactobacillales bacterium]